MEREPLISIRCLVYNHEPFLRQCLDGIVMQQTDYPYEAIVHDDASTDGSAAIIREYAEKYPDIIKPIFETENQFRKDRSVIRKKMDAACRGKYWAVCEGDDFWTDPQKLQMQVSVLESNPDCSMCCSAVKYYSQKQQRYTRVHHCRKGDGSLPVEDVIKRGGLYIPSCSIVYRKSIKDHYPDYCLNCHVGDFPLQIMCAMKGEIYYFDRYMATYRIENNNSWIGQNENKAVITAKDISRWKSEVDMYKGYAKDYPKYGKVFQDRIAYFLNYRLPNPRVSREQYSLFAEAFKDELLHYSLFWRIDAYFRHRRGLLSRAYKWVAARTMLSSFGMKYWMFKYLDE